VRNAAWDAVESPDVAHQKLGWGHMVQAIASCHSLEALGHLQHPKFWIEDCWAMVGKKPELANHCIEMTLFFDLDTAMIQWQSHDWAAVLNLVSA